MLKYNTEAVIRTVLSVIGFVIVGGIIFSFPKTSLVIALLVLVVLGIKENYEHHLFQIELKNQFKNQNKFEGGNGK
jgi:hypothetical protein